VDDLISATSELIVLLEQHKITYAVGGALALAVWAVPRATLDIDINVWCAPEETKATLERIFSFGVEGDLQKAIQQAQTQGVSYLKWRGIRLDVFFPSIEFYEEALRTRVRLQFPQIGIAWVLCAETVVVFKLLFFRAKDLIDVEKILRVQGASLDRGYIRGHLVAMLGGDDDRVVHWDSLCARIT
jgi:hypothetical protein